MIQGILMSFFGVVYVHKTITVPFGKWYGFLMPKAIILSPCQLELLEQLKQLNQLEINLASCSENGIISLETADAASQLLMLKKQEYQLKEKLIANVHVTNNGTPRKIEYKESKNLWMTIMPNGQKVYGKEREIVIDKLMEKYGLSTTDFRFKTIFEQALEHKDRTESVSKETLYYLESSFTRFIDEKMAQTDIRTITCDMLSEYTLNMLRTAQTVDAQGVTHKLSKKAFLSFKSVLNVVFNYALSPAHYITSNPLDDFSNKAFYKECNCSKADSSTKIFSEGEIDVIKSTVRIRMNVQKYHGYFINGYAILLSIETGMRAGELPSLKWSDIYDNYIHIHSQQLSQRQKGGKRYFYADWTKNEKGVPQGGRKYPLTKEIRDLLAELKKIQDQKGIVSDFVFCHEDGEWIKTDAYITCLRRLLRSLGYEVTNNHAFRMSLNSNILDAKLRLPVAKRAALLGHSVETNLKYYTHPAKDDMDDLVDLFDSCNKISTEKQMVSPRSHQNVVNFKQKESSEHLISQAF